MVNKLSKVNYSIFTINLHYLFFFLLIFSKVEYIFSCVIRNINLSLIFPSTTITYLTYHTTQIVNCSKDRVLSY